MQNFRTYVKRYVDAVAFWEERASQNYNSPLRATAQREFRSSRGSINECLHVASSISRRVGVRESFSLLLKIHLGTTAKSSQSKVSRDKRMEIIDQINQTIGRCSDVQLEVMTHKVSEVGSNKWLQYFLEACAKHLMYIIVGGLIALTVLIWHILKK
jgi:hypothetical protein